MALEIIAVQDETYDRDGGSATLLCRCLWSERVAVCYALTGGYTRVGGSMEFVAPSSYPYNSSLVVNNVSIEPEGDLSKHTAQHARLTIQYGVPDYPDEEDLFTTSISVSAEGIALPKENFTWSSGSKNGEQLSDSDAEVSKWIPFVSITMSSPWLPRLDAEKMGEKMNHVNSGSFAIPNDDTLDAGTILFLGANNDQTRSTDGYQMASRSLEFAYRKDGWNKIWSPEDNDFESLTPDIYESTTFDELFE